MSDISLLITATDGVNTLTSINFEARSGVHEDREYSDTSWSVLDNIKKGILYPPEGGMFELKFPNDDIKGRVI